jgi:alpha/beta superfamily hydrolase
LSSRAVERRLIAGPAGNLEVATAAPDHAPLGLAILAHPHPLYGGSLDNKVVQTMARAFNALRFVAVRFNFRGVGRSDGVFDDGAGEIEDLLAVADDARRQHPGLALALGGFSFGGFVAAEAARTLHPGKLALIAPAVNRFPVPAVASGTLVVHGEEDDVVPLHDVLQWARPQQLPLVVFPGTGHFFHGMLIPLQALITRYFRDEVGSP